MKTIMLTAAFVALALPAYAAHTTRKFSPPTVSKQQEQAYNQTYTTEGGSRKRAEGPRRLGVVNCGACEFPIGTNAHAAALNFSG